ncbi:MAG: helix-turn-helix transcriptional regulator [Syntrophales bacterium]
MILFRIGPRGADPPIPAIIPVSRSTWYNGVKDGRFPQPVRLSTRCTAWRVEDIRALVSSMDPDYRQSAKVNSLDKTDKGLTMVKTI